MRRRDFITILGGAVAAWPLAALAQQPPRLPTIGFLGATTSLAAGHLVAAFVERLRELGWVEGRNVAIEYRWAEGRSARYTEIAAEFVRLKVDVMVTGASATALAAKQVTPVVPIVFAAAVDPVGTGLVASLARPGGNVTGLSIQSADLASKRVEFLREVVPDLRRLAVMANVGISSAALEMGEVRTAARAFGLDVVVLEIQRADDLAPAFEALKGGAQALYVATDAVVFINRNQISSLARGARLPTMYSFREYVEAGGLMSYGANFPSLWRRTADHVDKILRGTKAGDIPVEQPIRFDLVVNMLTAKALGLTLPPLLLVRADEVIE